MGVKRYYELADIKAAIDRAEGHYINLTKTVFGATDYDWTDKPIYNKKGELVKTLQKYTGPAPPKENADVGHTYRNHIGFERDQEYLGTRSFYPDIFTAVKVTQLLVNGDRGQRGLQALDDGTAIEYKIIDEVPGDYYGGNPGDKAFGLKKIEQATCIIMKLGDDTLWIHTSYPSHLQS